MNKFMVVSLIALLVVVSCNLYSPMGTGDSNERVWSRLSILSRAWHRASPPVDNDSLWYAPPAWKWYWFTPRAADNSNNVRRDEILVLNEEQSEPVGSMYETVLRLHVQPAPDQDTLEKRFGGAWAGITSLVHAEKINMDSMEYFQFYCKVENGFNGNGKLYLQLGTFSEDLSLNGGLPNGKLDKEYAGSDPRSVSYDSKRDLGVDFLPDTSEYYCIPGTEYGTWDTLRYMDPLLAEDSLDPAKDNFKAYYYESGNLDNYRYVCGTQLDGRVFPGEDVDTSGTLRTRQDESYFEVLIDLSDSLSSLIDTDAELANPEEWRKYRIPVSAGSSDTEGFTAVNSPDWSAIQSVRIFWRDFPEQTLSNEHQLILYGFEFIPMPGE